MRTIRRLAGSGAKSAFSAIVAATIAACSLSPPRSATTITAPIDAPRQDTPDASARNARVSILGSLAAVDLDFDRRPSRSPGPDLAWGNGYALAGELGLPEMGSRHGAATLRTEYVRTEHTEMRTDTRSEVHLASALLCLRPWEFGGETFAVGPRLCTGVGVLVADHAPGGPSDDFGLTATLGLDVELRLFRHVVLHGGGRVLFAGYPGETIAVGSVMLIGGGVTF